MIASPLRPLGDFLTENSRKVEVVSTVSYPMAGISSYAQGLFAKPSISGAETGYKVFHRIEPRQVVLSTLKGWEGAVTIADEAFSGRFLPPHNLLFDVDEYAIEVGYIAWVIRRSKVWGALKHASKGMGARRETVNAGDLLSICIPVAPLLEQRAIVERLDSAATSVAVREKAAGLVAADIDATLRAAFARIIADAPRVAMGEIAPLVRRPVIIDPDASYPELGVRSFGKGTFHKPSLPGIEVGTKKLFTVEAGDLVFNIVFAWEGAVAVAAEADAGRVGSHRFLTCVPDPDRATSEFLRFWFLGEEGMLALGQASPGGAGRNRTLGIKALEAIKVPVPSLDAQLWFDSLQSKARAAKAAQAEATAHLDQLLPAMLNEVFG